MAPFFVLESFLQFLLAEKRFSKHTLTAYENDIKQFFDFSQIDSDQSLVEINHQLVRSWVVTLVDQGLVSKTINRKISSLRTFVKWCQANNYIVLCIYYSLVKCCFWLCLCSLLVVLFLFFSTEYFIHIS